MIVDYRGLPAVRWSSRDGAVATATLQGAHIVSWTPAGGGEPLFVSERSAFVAGRAIRGGIPVCFPQFAERGPLVKHGFARIVPWRYVGTSESEEGARVSFELSDSPQTLALWPHPFGLELVATLRARTLTVELNVANTGGEAFDFAAALHTYLQVSDCASVRLEGLGQGGLTAADPIDRIFFGAPARTRLVDGARAVVITQEAFADTVVWNPGRDLTAGMPDMEPEGYRRMLCVEAAAVEPRIALRAGARWRGSQALQA